MRRLFVLILASVMFIDATPVKKHDIAILLHENTDAVLLEADGPVYIYDPYNKTHIRSGILAKRFLVHMGCSGIKWGEEFVHYRNIKVVPASPETSLLVNGIQYDGSISIYEQNGKIDVVNNVEIEDLVISVLSTKCANIVDSEVMSTVAILARTNAYFALHNNPKSSNWQLEAKDLEYMGCGTCTPKSLVREIVKTTAGLSLVENAAFIPTTWTEHSAGVTASFAAIFRTHDFGTSIKTPLSGKVRNDTQWSFETSKKRLGKLLGMKNVTAFKSFIDKPSGKVYALRVISGDTCRDYTFFELQKALGKGFLQSNDFTLRTDNDRIIFDGYGIGHSVGVCLYTAKELAADGANALDIIKTFYPRAKLINVYSESRL